MTDDPEVSRWLEAARNGDDGAFGLVVEHFQDLLLARIRLMMGPDARRAADSIDFVQEVLADVLRRPEATPLDDERGLLRWMTAVARNRIRDEIRRRRERTFSALSSVLHRPTGSEEGSATGVESGELELLAEALEALPEDQREVIELRDLESLSYREIGERLGKSEEAARKQHARALLRLGTFARKLRQG